MTSEQFLVACVNAPPGMRAKIEMVLRGDESAVPHADEDARTCTIAEAGRRLNASRNTVYHMIKRGELKTATINGTDRVLIHSINAVVRGTVGNPDADADAIRRARLSAAGRAGAAARRHAAAAIERNFETAVTK